MRRLRDPEQPGTTTEPIINSTPSGRAEIEGMVQVGHAGITVDGVRCTNTSTAFNCSGDSTYLENMNFDNEPYAQIFVTPNLTPTA